MQACLHRRADIRRVTDSEQLCCELPVTAHGDAVSCAYRAIRLYEFMPPYGGKHRRKRREYHGTFQRASGRMRTGAGLGDHGNRRLHYLQDPGPCGSVRGRIHVYRRSGMRDDDAKRPFRRGIAAGGFSGRHSCRTGNGNFSYGDGDPGDPCGNPDPAWTVFHQPADHGKPRQSGAQRDPVRSAHFPAQRKGRPFL